MQVEVHEAKAQLSEVLDKVERGEEVMIAREGKPVSCNRTRSQTKNRAV
jgi:prevent-host-death family protein